MEPGQPGGSGARVRVRVLVDLSVAPIGGAATYAEGFATGLAEHGAEGLCDVVVVVDEGWAARNGTVVDGMRRAGVEVVVRRFAPAGSWRARVGRGREMRSVARERQIDVAFFPRDVAPRLDVPVVVLANNMYAWRSYGTGAAIGGRVPALLLRVMARRSVERSAAVLAVSQSMAEVVAGGVTAVVHHGCLHPPVLRSAETGGERPIVVTVVGNLNENKQTDLVLRGVAAATGGPWDLRVYGVRADEAYAAEVEALSCELFDRSVLEGPVVGPDLVDVYRQTDLVVVGGTFESFCHPLVEAMRAGATVVAPDTPLVAELCGDVAVTYEPGDHRSLADALLVATAERGERGPRGVERSASFTWTATVRRTLAVVRAAVSEVQGVPGAPAAVSAPPTAGEPGGGSGRATQASTPRSGAG